MQKRIKTARRALETAVRSLTRCWTALVWRLDGAVRGWRLGKSQTDGRNATSEREAA